jgi:hypothetical protein
LNGQGERILPRCLDTEQVYRTIPDAMNTFESPLESLFFDQLLKQLPRGVPLQTQVLAETRCGTFRLDMMATVQNRRVGIECDGKEYHDEYRDEWRDAMILGDGQADEIIRFRGCDLTYHLDDCMFLLSKIQPLLFFGRHSDVVERLASDRARRFAVGETDWRCGALLNYGFIDKSRAEDFIDIRRRTVEGLVTGVGREFWAVYYRFAIEHGGGPLDNMIERWRATDRCAWTVP